MDNKEKLQYIIRTMSRTNRKDYENYVLNAIYNRIGNKELVPITQQYIKTRNNRRYLIDMYFPQINVGIECDEEYHYHQINKDFKRERDIFDYLDEVNDNGKYKAFHIDFKKIKSIEELDIEINKIVLKIKKVIGNKKLDWDEVYPAINKDTIKKRRIIKVNERSYFKTINEVKGLFNKQANGQWSGSFKINDDYYAWFPKLAIDNKSVTKGWYNKISSDGKTIISYNENKVAKPKSTDHIPKVVFAQTKDPITRIKSYRFVGVFKRKKWNKGKFIYERVAEEFEIIDYKQ